MHAQVNLNIYKLSSTFSYYKTSVVPKFIHTFPKDGFLVWNLPPHPRGISRLASYCSSKGLVVETSLPLGISNDHPWDGYGYFEFLELHIGDSCYSCGCYFHFLRIKWGAVREFLEKRDCIFLFPVIHDNEKLKPVNSESYACRDTWKK